MECWSGKGARSSRSGVKVNLMPSSTSSGQFHSVSKGLQQLLSTARIGEFSLPAGTAVGICFALCWLAIFYVLPPPVPLEAGLDPSWQAYLTEMFLRHAQFGKDIVFTYGSWGFLNEPRGNPAIYPWLVLGRSILALGMAVSLSCLSLKHQKSQKYRWAWLLALLVLANPVVLAPLLLFAISSEPVGTPVRRLCMPLLILGCALTAHIKFTVLFMLIPLALLLLIEDSYLHRRFPFAFSWLIICYLGWYLAARQSLSGLTGYISNAVSITAGYTAGMNFGQPSITAVLLGTILCLIVPASYFLAIFPTQRSWAAVRAAWIGLFFFVGFKHTFVRYDGPHIWMGMMNHTLPGMLIIAMLIGRYPDAITRLRIHLPARRRVFAVSYVGVLLGFTMIGLLYFGHIIAVREMMWEKLKNTRSDLLRLNLSLSGPEARKRQYDKELVELRNNFPLTQLKGSVDLLTDQAYLLLAYPFEVRVRPVLQSYSTYNHNLARLNADFFISADAPQYVYVELDTIDERFHSLDDNLAWLSLLSNYEPADFSGKYLILRKAPNPRRFNKELLFEKTITWNEELRLPELPGVLLWAEIETHPTLTGRLLTTLYKPGTIRLLARRDSSEETYLLVPSIAQSGFLLSPVVKDAPSFAALYSGRAQLPPLSRILLRPSNLGRFTFSANLSVRIFRVNMQQRPGSPM
jgi:hypothetical protein